MHVRLLLEASNSLQTGLLESFRLIGESYIQSSSQLVASASISVSLASILITTMLNVVLSPKDGCLVNCDGHHVGHVLTFYEMIHSTHCRRVPSERWSITSAQMKSFQNDICYHKQGSLCEMILSIG